MLSNIIENIIKTSKDFGPMTIAINIILGIVFLAVSIIFLNKQKQNRKQKLFAYIFIVISISLFLGGLLNWTLNYIIF